MSGSYCRELGFTVDTVFGDTKPSTNKLSNGAVFEIFDYGLNVLKKRIVDIWRYIGDITSTPFQNINVTSCTNQYYRYIKQDKLKRGLVRDKFRQNIFHLITQTVSGSSESTSTLTSIAPPSKPLANVENPRKSSTIRLLREENKQLKRKLSVREKNIESQKDTIAKKQKLEKDVKKSEKSVLKTSKDAEKQRKKLKTVKSRLSTNIFQANLRIKKLETQLAGRTNQVTMIQNASEKLKCENFELVKKNANVNQRYVELDLSNQYLQNLVQDNSELTVFNEDKNLYTNDFVECAMRLTDLKVATKNVSPVVKTVATLCGKIIHHLPSRQTVDNIVDRKLSVAQKQLGKVLSDKKDTTIYTDETRKYGHTYQSYLITDETQTSYLLGLREMQNKSAKSTLDTLKEILSDIDKHCEQLSSQNNFGPGFQILRNIRNTMSDRASTEKLFNTLLEDYRCSILPSVIDDYDKLTLEEQKFCGQLNNFFCGLHLLVGIADVCEASIKRFETDYLDGQNIGSAKLPELKRFHKSESGTLRLIRTCSKAFAKGEDEKNGVFLPWTTFLDNRKSKNQIIRFRHNRFNVVFVVGQAVFYHREEIVEFLGNVHGHSNTLLKATFLDCQENLYLAGAKAFGLISKFINTPLWRLIEEPGNILDMNQHFEKLVTFLQNPTTEKKLNFITGISTPFKTIIEPDDDVLKSLIQPAEEIDEIVVQLLEGLFLAIKELILRMVPEHLPGGKYWEADEQLRASSSSAMKHNKLPEFIFGQLDHLVSFRPNASVLTNEAYLMYAFNKTAKWLEQLPEDERKKHLDDSRKEGRHLRKEFRKRLEIIKQERIQIQQKKKEELARLEAERIRKAEVMTNDVCFYGLWQSQDQINEAIGRLTNGNEIQKALHAQLKFRKNILNQKHSDKQIFNFSKKNLSGKYQKLTNEELAKNLTELVQTAVSGPTLEQSVSDVPLLVGKKISHKFADGILYRGRVINVVPGFPMWYNVKYEDDDSIYSYNLQEDYRIGDLQIVID